MKEFGPPGGGGGTRPWRPPLGPPMVSISDAKTWVEYLLLVMHR